MNLQNAIRHLLGAAAACASMSAAVQVQAAQPAQPAVSSGIEEVLVTARRREESLQEVPLSIAAIGNAELEARNVTDLRQVNGQIPNVVIATGQFAGTGGSQFRMRGLPGVVLYQDGAPAEGGALPSFTDIERVEVLRGPQGTLFGRASIGGAIQIVTRKPQDTFAADLRTSFGSKDRVDLTANINVPLTDTLFVKATGSSLQRDGYVTSTRSNTVFGSQDDKFARLDVLWRPTDSIEARVQYAQTENASSGSPYVNAGLEAVCSNTQAPPYWFDGTGIQRYFAPTLYCLASTVDINPAVAGVQPLSSEFHSYGLREEYVNTIDARDTGWEQNIDDLRMEVTWNLTDAAALRVLASKRDGQSWSFEDLDGTGLDIFQNRVKDIPTEFDTRTGELQFIWTGERLTGTTGIYYEESPGSVSTRFGWINSEIFNNPAVTAAWEAAYPGSTLIARRTSTVVQPVNAQSGPTVGTFGSLGQNESEIKAAFAEWTLAATDKLRLTAGIRYTEQESVSTQYTQVINVPDTYVAVDPAVDYFSTAGGVRARSVSNLEQYTPRFSVQYQWTPEIMTYLTYSKAATTSNPIQTVDAAAQAQLGLPFSTYAIFPTTVKNYEFGWRADLFDRTLRLNGTVFFADMKNAQLSEAWLPGRLFATNADAEVKGAEIEGQWLVTNAFTLNYGLGWIDAEYTNQGTTRNMTPGTPFALTPEHTFALGGQYEWALDGAGLTLRADYNWQDEQQSSVERITAATIDAVGLLSARLTYRPDGRNWDVSLSGTNLTDEYYLTAAFLNPETTATTGMVGRPREWAVNFNVRFE